MINNYVSLDLETSGLNPKIDKIIEIGAVKVVDGEIVGTYSTFVNPGIKLGEKTTKITGITDSDLESASMIEAVIFRLFEFIGDFPLLGHSVLFDYSFVKKAAVNQKMTFEKQGIDTLRIARKYLPDLESRNLGFLCRYYEIPIKEHRALEDAKATHYLYQKLCRQFLDKTSDKTAEFQPHDLIYRVKKESPITKYQKERLYELIHKHRLVVDYQVEYLTKNEASRYTDKILSEYGR